MIINKNNLKTKLYICSTIGMMPPLTNVNAGFHFSEFGRANRYDRVLLHWKEAIWLAFACCGRENVQLDSTSRTDCAFASKRLLSAWISRCPSLGRAAEFAEVETGVCTLFIYEPVNFGRASFLSFCTIWSSIVLKLFLFPSCRSYTSALSEKF